MTVRIVRFVLILIASQMLASVDGTRIKRAKPKITVTAVLSFPYVMKDTDSSGVVKYKGFQIDMLKRVAEMANFDYTLFITPDNLYGTINKTTQTWNGMIGEIIAKRAEVAVALFARTETRSNVVDFTPPVALQDGTFVYKKGTGDGDIADLEELTNVPNIKFGFLESTIMMRTFQLAPATDTLKHKIWKIYEAGGSIKVLAYDVAIKTVRESEPGIAIAFSYFFAKYHVAQAPCVLRMVGLLGSIQTSWAVAKGSKLKAAIDKAISTLKSTGELESMLEKWTSGPCGKVSGSDRAVVTFGTIVFGLVLSMTALY